MRTAVITVLVALVVLAIPVGAIAGTTKSRFRDADGNGIPDKGEVVTGAYKSVYAYDDTNWYWDLGDGRVHGTVAGIDALDEAKLTVCDYKVQYRGAFENDSFLDSGWIKNNVNCSGYDDNNSYNYLIVHQTDRRYTGNPDWAIWGTWEFHVLTETGSGNLARPETPVGVE